jgi:predicted TIM-barrel fold metal-dependent hydrolase
MSRFIFSADSHISEPARIYLEKLPSSMHHLALRTEKQEKTFMVKMGDTVLLKLQLGDGFAGSPRHGSNDLVLRRKDMEADGIDAEVLFPNLALMLYNIPDWEIELATAQIYNDWCIKHVEEHRDVFVPAAVLPVGKLSETLNEFKRVAALGYTAAMLPAVTPEGVPRYNSEDWDPIFAFAAAARIPLIYHTGTGLANVVVERGPGAAIFNYTRQINDAMDTFSLLIAGGVLDRNPGAKVVAIESGASWLGALGERMDEVARAHDFYVRPKLSRAPSQIIRDQMACSFQFDRAGIMSRHVTGTQALLWASDYPHMEGTFPNSRDVLDKLFDGIDISEQEKDDILGGNAAKLFRLNQAVPA